MPAGAGAAGGGWGKMGTSGKVFLFSFSLIGGGVTCFKLLTGIFFFNF